MNYLEGGTISTSGGNNNNTNGLTSFNNGAGAIVLDISPWMTAGLTSNAGIPGLFDQLNTLLCGGQISTGARSQIISFVANTTNFPLSSPVKNTEMQNRIRSIIHLMVTSPEYTVQR
jgi:hypothetical protein